MALACKTCFIDLFKAMFRPALERKREREFTSKKGRREEERKKERKKKEEGRMNKKSSLIFNLFLLFLGVSMVSAC